MQLSELGRRPRDYITGAKSRSQRDCGEQTGRSRLTSTEARLAVDLVP